VSEGTLEAIEDLDIKYGKSRGKECAIELSAELWELARAALSL